VEKASLASEKPTLVQKKKNSRRFTQKSTDQVSPRRRGDAEKTNRSFELILRAVEVLAFRKKANQWHFRFSCFTPRLSAPR
jgi:hypothetical protein